MSLNSLTKKVKTQNSSLNKSSARRTRMGKTWNFIIDSVNESINQELNKKFKNLDEKLVLRQTQEHT